MSYPRARRTGSINVALVFSSFIRREPTRRMRRRISSRVWGRSFLALPFRARGEQNALSWPGSQLARGQRFVQLVYRSLQHCFEVLRQTDLV
jgi:hypothetical protein